LGITTEISHLIYYREGPSGSRIFPLVASRKRRKKERKKREEKVNAGCKKIINIIYY
jgi:hypothetical protein